MPLSPYIRGLREAVGRQLVLLPSVSVLVWDETGRLLLVREAETRRWQTIGGAIEPDESARDAALRETFEEAGVTIELQGIRDVLGGPQFRLRYSNGDLVSYVPTVFDAHVIDGTPRPDGEETIDVRWFTPHELGEVTLTDFTLALFQALGIAHGARHRLDPSRQSQRGEKADHGEDRQRNHRQGIGAIALRQIGHEDRPGNRRPE